jgi:hypothetical protein
MPAIQVYKHTGNLPSVIPVEEAKKAKAYQCPFTKTIFLTKRGYVKHLGKLRQNRMWANARKLRHRKRLENLWNQPSFNDVINWININSDAFWLNGRMNGWVTDHKSWDKIRDDFQIRITYLDLTWSNRVDNSHSCPHNGETNWGGGKAGVPRGYPGWTGTISFQLSHDVPSFSSNLLKGTRIHTGTGGGGGKNLYTYGVTLFADDWPGVFGSMQSEREEYERDHLLDMIKNQYVPYRVPNFTFGKRLR